MRIIRITCIKERTGVSTILGTLIFIGIMFTAIIPMMLVMNQADTLYERQVLETKRVDEARDLELLNVYAYPEAPGSSFLEVEVENESPVPIRLVRAWINNTFLNLTTVINSMETEIIGPFDVSLEVGTNSTYVMSVTTERGNVFPSGSGPIIYDGSDWVSEFLGIFVQISGSGFLGFGQYRVTVQNVTVTNVPFYDQQETSFASGTASLIFDVTEAGSGTYNVYVEKKSWFTGWSYKDDKDVEIEWPSGPPVEWVYFE
jgi:hypothetical protein